MNEIKNKLAAKGQNNVKDAGRGKKKLKEDKKTV